MRRRSPESERVDKPLAGDGEILAQPEVLGAEAAESGASGGRCQLLTTFVWAPSLLDHLIRPQQQRRRDREAERLGGLQVDDQLELRGLLYGQIAGLGALEDFIDVACGAPVESGTVVAIGHETTVSREEILDVYPGQLVLGGERQQSGPMNHEYALDRREEPFDALFDGAVERAG